MRYHEEKENLICECRHKTGSDSTNLFVPPLALLFVPYFPVFLSILPDWVPLLPRATSIPEMSVILNNSLLL